VGRIILTGRIARPTFIPSRAIFVASTPAAPAVAEVIDLVRQAARHGGVRRHVPVDVPRLGRVGAKLDSDDLVGAADVAAILRLSHPSSVTTYMRRYPDFPKPVVNLSASRVRLWRRQDIERWHNDRTTPR